MRDIVVSLLILGMLPTCFRKPFVGLLLFSLLAYMRLQDLTWGFAREVRWSFMVAIITFAGFFASRREGRFMVSEARTVIMILLAVLVGLSILTSRDSGADAIALYTEYVKIILIALFTTGIVATRDRLRAILWVITLSFAFYGLKGGVAGILSGGSIRILQGPGGMLRDNNDFALAMCMALPMLWYTARSERRDILRRFLIFCVPLAMITITLTYSRGGFLAMGVTTLLLIWRSRNRVAGFALGGLVLVAGVLAAPEAYKDRISTITTYEEDASAMARLYSWRTAGYMALANPILGVGYAQFEERYRDYEPAARDSNLGEHGVHVAHNSYLQVWAECGTIALLLYLTLVFLSLYDLWRVRALARKRYRTSWIENYCSMFEASLVAYLVGSVFLNRAHFDLFYHWVGLIVAFGIIARRELTDEERYPERGEERGVLRPSSPGGFGAIGRAAGVGPRVATGRLS
ncbi:MAG: putative O-glycosylation ligase, exosortase A system-associated [Planctomycetota bacterium]|jgi:probable O-glycosylation ligase (exosortase A-associated)|nr:putative O-glycosylation ligase, exosortase A system-associated [Planctomycetota bacterium]MDP6989471.1 putative O-glycosylation ligase, exosortase A system-associated [Planctomycetota bacterium]